MVDCKYMQLMLALNHLLLPSNETQVHLSYLVLLAE